MTSIGIGQSLTTTVETDRLRPVRLWLYVMALMVLLMVAVGGVTRLTGSGLSITSWEPISGVIPPLSDTSWQAEFDHYKLIPQYAVDNSTMTLDGFKAIFWPEWTHRLLGRLIGLVFAIPFLAFLIQRRFSWKLAGPLALLFVAGGLQGVLGWWMVSSGLENLTSVSQYRLAAHLSAALVLFLALIWVARSLEPKVKDATAMLTSRWPVVLSCSLLVALLQIAAGAFVAGLHAGMGYNTWPLMDGLADPSGPQASIDPFWRNLFENADDGAVRSPDHRLCHRHLSRRACFGGRARAGEFCRRERLAAAPRRPGAAAGRPRHHDAADLRAPTARPRPSGAGLHAGRGNDGLYRRSVAASQIEASRRYCSGIDRLR